MFVNVSTTPDRPQDGRTVQIKACSVPMARVCGYPGLFAERSVIPDDRHFDLPGAVMHKFLAWMRRSRGMRSSRSCGRTWCTTRQSHDPQAPHVALERLACAAADGPQPL